MNSTPALPLRPALAVPAARTRALRPGDACLEADWRGMLFLHFSLPPEMLAPHVPFELETHEGRAFVSLVLFRLEKMRPAGAGWIGRKLLEPLSDHWFLNLRTYVRHNGRPTIHFLAEWITNRLSLHLGPLLYGLPYRLARFGHDVNRDTGIEHLRVTGRREGYALDVAFPTLRPAEAVTCAPGSADEFLLERYTAVTCHRGTKRWFDVDHKPWKAMRPDWIRFNPALIDAAFPWFRGAEFHSAHHSEGVFDVRMGRPHRIAA